MGNGKPKAILFDWEVLFCFDRWKFCNAFAVKAEGDEKLAYEIYRLLFGNRLYEGCNRSSMVFDSVYDIAYHTVESAKLGTKPPRETLYDCFVAAWNSCFAPNEEVKERILKNARAPVALFAIINPHHYEKIVSSKIVRIFCRASYVSWKPHRRHDVVNAIKIIASKIAIPPERFLYVGNDYEHTAQAKELGLMAMRHSAPYDIQSLHQRLALCELVK